MSERTLATIRRIADIKPIEGADFLELAIVDGWQCVVAKEVGHKVNDLIVFYEIDSLLPEREEFEFLRKNCYVKNTLNGDGFRIKTIKLRKQISQGLVMPVDEHSSDNNVAIISGIPEGAYTPFLIVEEGEDVTEFLGVKKYEKVLGATLSGIAKGNFPSFIPKTDAERIQNCFRTFEREWKDHIFEATIKLDGTSGTFYYNRHTDVFGVCSRNLDLVETEDNLYWKIARKYDIETKLKSLPFSAAIQGEIAGEGIQGNKEGLNEVELFVFNIYDIDKGAYIESVERGFMVERLGLKETPIIGLMNGYDFDSVQDFLDLANGPSYKAKKREGVVFKSVNDPSVQFKCISNEWLLDNDD